MRNIVAGQRIRRQSVAESSGPFDAAEAKLVAGMAKPVSEEVGEIANVGAISANNDNVDWRTPGRSARAGRQRRRHHGRRGQDGEIRHGRAMVDGMQFDKGFISPYFINDPARPWNACWKTRCILIHEKKISNHPRLDSDLWKKWVPVGQDHLLIIAEDVES